MVHPKFSRKFAPRRHSCVMFRTTRTGSGYKYHPLADSLYSFHVHLAFHHFLQSLVVPGVECLLLPSTRTSSLSMVTAEPVSTSILVGLVPTQPSTKTTASLAMLPAEWVAYLSGKFFWLRAAWGCFQVMESIGLNCLPGLQLQ